MTRKKKAAAILAALALVLGLGPGALAAQADPAAEGTVRITAEETDYRDDLAESTVKVAVYKVADVDENGLFTLAERFAPLAENEQWNEGRLGAETKMQDLLDGTMALIVPAPAEDAEAEAESPEPALAPDMETETAAVDGEIKLGLGLYVLVPEEVQTERWVYTFSPMMLTMPATVDGAWSYELPVSMKAERESRLTEIVIDKTLTSYNASLGPTTFVFDVEGVLDGQNVFSNTVSLTFSGAGTQSATVSGIPVGAHVTVTETYSGASYVPADGRVSVEIEELPLPEGENVTRVPFTNTYDERLVPDASVVNTFVFNGTGWQWTSQSEEG